MSSQFPGIGAWAMGILRAPDEELLDVAGLEGFVFMRLMRMGCRLSLFGTVLAVPVTWIFLSEGVKDCGDDDCEPYRFLNWTVNAVVSNDWKLWVAVAAVWLETLHTLYDVIQECEAFVKLRQQFLTKTEIMEDDPQATYSIMVERVPRECRADAADANVVLVFTKSDETTWGSVAEAFALEDAPVVDTEAPTDEEPDEEVAPPSINRDDAPPPPPPAAPQTFAAPEFQNTLLYNID